MKNIIIHSGIVASIMSCYMHCMESAPTLRRCSSHTDLDNIGNPSHEDGREHRPLREVPLDLSYAADLVTAEIDDTTSSDDSDIELDDEDDGFNDVFSALSIEDYCTLVKHTPGSREKLQDALLLSFALTGDHKEVRDLLHAKADPNARGSHQQTPLHCCAANQCATKMAALLLHYKADINAQDELGNTPLHVAAAHGALIKNTADINAQDNLGITPLHVAAAHGALIKNYVMRDFLIKQPGIKLHIKNNDGFSGATIDRFCKQEPVAVQHIWRLLNNEEQ